MSKTRFIQNLMITSTVALLLTVSAIAQDYSLSPSSRTQTLGTLSARDVPMQTPAGDILQPVQVGNATYITGGIGDEERHILQVSKNNYNLHIMSAERTGHFHGDTRVVIQDQRGNVMIDAEAGPLFYASLPAGSYTVEATSEGRTKRQRVMVNERKASSIHFSWP